jgi:lycopene cyclase domain-containing protein
MSTYILVNLLAVSIPFVLSFDKKVHYYKRWKYLFPSIGILLFIFIVWDIIFTARGIWGFNPIHLSNFNIINLPPGEWLFFITVPYSSVFIYDVFKAYLKKSPLENISKAISMFLIGFLFILAMLSWDKAYTFLTFLLLSLTILYLHFGLKVKFMGWFYFAYLITMIPFLIVNGVLTGTGIEEEIVWYNNEENLGIRMLTIPVEDVFYGMLLLLGNVWLYEYFQSRAKRKKAS